MQLTRRGFRPPSAEDVRSLAGRFEQCHCVKLEQFVEPEVLGRLATMVDAAPFKERIHAELEPPAVDLCIDDPRTRGRLMFLMNDASLFRTIETVTGCSHVASFSGTVYRMIPETHHLDSWHDDLDENRLIALSLNLSRNGYAGGILQIREQATQRILHEVANTGFGDAILFRIAPHLEHRLTPIEPGHAKTAWAGWFRSGPLPSEHARDIMR